MARISDLPSNRHQKRTSAPSHREAEDYLAIAVDRA